MRIRGTVLAAAPLLVMLIAVDTSMAKPPKHADKGKVYITTLAQGPPLRDEAQSQPTSKKGNTP